MKLTKEVEITLSLKAILNDAGDLQMTLTASAPYGNRTASASLSDFSKKDSDKVRKVLGEILEDYSPRAAALAENGAAEARVAAVRLGEGV